MIYAASVMRDRADGVPLERVELHAGARGEENHRG